MACLQACCSGCFRKTCSCPGCSWCGATTQSGGEFDDLLKNVVITFNRDSIEHKQFLIKIQQGIPLLELSMFYYDLRDAKTRYAINTREYRAFRSSILRIPLDGPLEIGSIFKVVPKDTIPPAEKEMIRNWDDPGVSSTDSHKHHSKHHHSKHHSHHEHGKHHGHHSKHHSHEEKATSIKDEIDTSNTNEIDTSNTDEIDTSNTDEIDTNNTDEIDTSNTDDANIPKVEEE